MKNKNQKRPALGHDPFQQQLAKINSVPVTTTEKSILGQQNNKGRQKEKLQQTKKTTQTKTVAVPPTKEQIKAQILATIAQQQQEVYAKINQKIAAAQQQPLPSTKTKRTASQQPITKTQTKEQVTAQLLTNLDERLQKITTMATQTEEQQPQFLGQQAQQWMEDFWAGLSINRWYRQRQQAKQHQFEESGIDPFGLDPEFEAKVEQLADFLYRRWWRVQTTGIDHIPTQGRSLIVANHAGVLPYDAMMIKHAVRREHPARRTVRFLLENYVYYMPFLGTAMTRYGAVRANMDNASRILNDNQLAVVFPEGIKGLSKRYEQRYQLQRFGRGGFIKLAIRTQSPIIPTAVIGSEEIHPVLRKIHFNSRPLGIPFLPFTPTFPWLGLAGMVPLPSKWAIRFGEPLLFALSYAPKDADNETLVHELTLQVRRVIHQQIHDLLATRQHVFLG